MNKLMMLAVFALVFFVMIETSHGFCGGCGCNIFGCNCDIYPGPYCDGKWNIWGRREKGAIPDMFEEFAKMDTNNDGLVSLEETGLEM
jgi:hypothetical protein